MGESSHFFSCRCVPELYYAGNRERRQSLDIYMPEQTQGPVPVILNIHGGAWKVGDKGAPGGEVFFVEAGFALVRVNYRYSTQAPYPAQLEDLHSAIRYLQKNAEALGLDMDRLVCIGHSAGGHLASMLALTARQSPDIQIRACVNQAGPTQLADLGQWRVQNKPSDGLNSIETLMGAPFPECAKKAAESSPVNHAHADAPPHLLIYGDADETVPHSEGQALQTALEKSGAQSELCTLPGAGHVAPEFWQEPNYQRILDFYRKHL
ncbi:MAG: alpha/beta hydrolase fold domain-containing protein [Candidatus Sumerlaeia bacterium]